MNRRRRRSEIGATRTMLTGTKRNRRKASTCSFLFISSSRSCVSAMHVVRKRKKWSNLLVRPVRFPHPLAVCCFQNLFLHFYSITYRIVFFLLFSYALLASVMQIYNSATLSMLVKFFAKQDPFDTCTVHSTHGTHMRNECTFSRVASCLAPVHIFVHDEEAMAEW